MSSALRKPGAKPKRPNIARRIMEREERVRSNAAAAAAAAAANVSRPSRPQCPNKTSCPGSDVRDGVCHGCGVVVDDSNIVAEVQFSEGSNGAAIVQGSYMGADQGGVRPVSGTAFRRIPGGGANEARERTFREIKQLIGQFARQLRIPDSLAETGFRNYKMASLDFNFVQGRQRNNVAAMCLYAACRREESCKVMLIDLADLVRYDVFALGHDYKEFLKLYPAIKEGTRPIIMEDLIFRFASRLEFGRDTNKVALSAVRIAQRMRYDEMTHGRKPAGICGASLIMAARAHNYRRTVREVVYIAKVTMHTLQARMEEFSNVPSAQMSVEEFTNQDFLEAHHDPPLVYKRSQEWQEKHAKKLKKSKKRRAEDAGEETEGQEGQGAAKRQKTAPQEGTQEVGPETAQSGEIRQSVEITACDSGQSKKRSHDEIGESADGQGREKRQKTPPQRNPESAASSSSTNLPGTTIQNPITMTLSPSASPEPEAPPQVNAPVIDKDGFVVPPRPTPSQAAPNLDAEDRAAIQMATQQEDAQLPILAGRFDDPDSDERDDDDLDPSSERAMAIAQGLDVPSRGQKVPRGRKGKGKEKAVLPMPIDEDWEADEAALEDEMEAHLNDSQMISNAKAALRDEKKKKKQDRIRAKKEAAAKQAELEKAQARSNKDASSVTGSTNTTQTEATGQTQTTEQIQTTEQTQVTEDPEAAENAAESHTAATSAQQDENSQNENGQEQSAQDETAEGGNAQDENTENAEDPRWPAYVYTVSADPIVHEHEFRDDPEVLYCRLSEEEVRIKEMIWVNHNKDYMREMQQKVFTAKMEEKNPKKTRARRKKPRLGEGQTTPASTPGEAAANALSKRNLSMRINYDFDNDMFMSNLRGPGSLYGGASSVGTRSAVTSRAGSVEAASPVGSEAGRGDRGGGMGVEMAGVGGGLRSPSPEVEETGMEDVEDDVEESDGGMDMFAF